MNTPPKPTKLSNKALRQRAEAQLKKKMGIKQASPNDYAAKKMLHELQVHQIELEMQNEELKQARITERLHYRYTELFEFAPVAYFSFDRNGIINQVNLRGAGLLGIERANLVGKQFSNYVTAQHRDIFKCCLVKAFADGGIQSCEVLAEVGKHTLWLDIEANLGITETDCLVTVTDITSRKLAEEKLKLAANVFNHALEGIFITDQRGYIIELNKACCAITGFSKNELLKAHISIFTSNQGDNIETALQQSKNWQGDVTYRRKNGEIYFAWLEAHIVEHEKEGITNRIYSCLDLNKSKSAEEKIQFLSRHDPLTGLFNRIALFTRLEDAISRAIHKQVTMAVLLVNIHDFKAINEQHGHDPGDAVLKEIARRFKCSVFEKDTVARLGGDEFVIIVDELENEQDVADIAQNIAAQFDRNFEITPSSAALSARIGIALCPDDGTNVDTLLGNAEKAMQRGKFFYNNAQVSETLTAPAQQLKDNKQCANATAYHFYTSKLTDHSRQQVLFEKTLKQALAQKQFELYYQPQYDLTKRQVVALEALLYWNHPERGPLYSDSFASLAEHSGLTVPIGLMVIRKAALQAVIWENSAINFGRIAINLSKQQLLENTFIADLQTILLETKCSSHWLEFEIDEIIFRSYSPVVYENLVNIAKIGATLTVTNIAEDQPMLYLLEQLKIEKFKISKSDTKITNTGLVGSAVNDAIFTLARSLGIDVVAGSLGNNFSSADNLYSGAHQKRSNVMTTSAATFYLRCNKRK